MTAGLGCGQHVTSTRRAQTPGQEGKSRGREEEKDGDMKDKQSALGLLPVSTSRRTSSGRQWAVPGSITSEKNLYLCSQEPAAAPGQGGETSSGRPFSIELPFPASWLLKLMLSWIQVATLPAFSPFPKIPSEGQTARGEGVLMARS